MEKNNELQIFNSDVLSMPKASFVNATLDQKKIRNFNKDNEILNKSITVFILELERHFSPKNKTDPFIIKDIKNMILSIGKNLSIEELFYASQLCRYGEIPNIESYGNLTTPFVVKIIVGYKKWKSNLRIVENLPLFKKTEKKPLTTDQKNEIMLKGYHRIFTEFKKNQSLETLQGCAWLYDYLVKDLQEFCPTDKEIAVAKTKASKIGLKSFKNDKRIKGIGEMQINRDIETLKKRGMTFKGIAKTLLLADYFKRRLLI